MLLLSIRRATVELAVELDGNGGKMGSVAWAAYDIAFWLHHCNIDRVYEAFLELEPDSVQEFENFQDTQAKDLFEAGFEPFRKADGSHYTPADTFNTKALAHVYDALPNAPPQQLREPPTLILFAQVKVFEFESKCYQIHAFVVAKDKQDEFKAPATVDDIDFASPNYAGSAGIFGRGMECENCVSRPPQDIAIDITRSLRTLGVSRYDVVAKVLVLETTEDSAELLDVADTPLPAPVITGPLFVDPESAALLYQEDKATNDAREAEALQLYLRKFGYYAPERKVDGDYGDYTKQAVEDLQGAAGDLKEDGVAGPKTRGAIIAKKRCDNVDRFAKNNVRDETVERPGKLEMKVFIDVQPGYLQRQAVVTTVEKACAEWAKHNTLSCQKSRLLFVCYVLIECLLLFWLPCILTKYCFSPTLLSWHKSEVSIEDHVPTRV